MDYYKKYLKYKSKYYNLQKLIGGLNKNKSPTKKSDAINLPVKEEFNIEEELNFVVCTHDGRMRCFVKQFFDDEKNDINNTRFMNCAILKLELSGENATLSLIHSGHVDDEKRQYFASGKDIEISDDTLWNLNHKLQKKIIGKGFQPITKKLQEIRLLDNIKLSGKKINIYIIRHGQGSHNIKNKLSPSKIMTKDPELTVTGIQQAIIANHVFKQYIGDTPIDLAFCSKLHRTFQTLGIVLSIDESTSRKDITLEKFTLNYQQIIVLPCAHELHFKKSKSNKNCDELNSSRIVANENKSKCSNLEKDKNSSYCKGRDWNYYIEFKKNKNKCKNTNMINILISIWENIHGISF